MVSHRIGIRNNLTTVPCRSQKYGSQVTETDRNQPGNNQRRSRLYRCEGVVIRRRDFGEADRLLTLMTDNYGKIRALAKGTRRTKSRLGGHLEPYARTSVLIAKGRNLDIVTQASVIDPMHQLRMTERSILYASHWSELADKLMVEQQENRFAYGALVRALTSIEHGRAPDVTSRICEWEFLSAAGFQPELLLCTGCGARIQPGQNGLHIEAGGVVCPECHAREPQSRDISNDALRMLRAIGRGDGELLHGRDLSQVLLREVEDTLLACLRAATERDLQAYRILRELEDTQPSTNG